MEEELEIEKDHAKNMDLHYRERVLKPEMVEKEQIRKERDQLKNQIAAESKKLAEKEIAERERIITSLRCENQRLTRDLNFKEGKIISLTKELVEKDKGEVVADKSAASQETQTTEKSEVERQKEIKNLETEINGLRREISQLKATEQKETEILVEVKNTEVQTDKIEQPPQTQNLPSSTTTMAKLPPTCGNSVMLNSSRIIYFSEEEDKIIDDLSERRQELIKLSEQAIVKEKEIMELRRQLFKIEYERINKQYEEKAELVTLIIQDLKNR